MTDSTTDSINTLIFDWDGTLNDSAVNGFAAFQKSLDELGVPFTAEFYEANYCSQLVHVYEMLALPRDQWQRADDLWINITDTRPARLSSARTRNVKELHRRSYRLGIVTIGSHGRVTRELEEMGLANFSDGRLQRTYRKIEPHPEGLEQAGALIGSRPEECPISAMLPKTSAWGKARAFHTVAVRSAYPTSKNLSSTGPDIYLDNISDLLLHFLRA